MSIFLRNIPIAVLIPLTILWFGIDETQKTMFIFIATVPFVFFDTVRAITSRARPLRGDRADAGSEAATNRRQGADSTGDARVSSADCATSSVWRSVTSCSLNWSTRGTGSVTCS